MRHGLIIFKILYLNTMLLPIINFKIINICVILFKNQSDIFDSNPILKNQHIHLKNVKFYLIHKINKSWYTVL